MRMEELEKDKNAKEPLDWASEGGVAPVGVETGAEQKENPTYNKQLVSNYDGELNPNAQRYVQKSINGRWRIGCNGTELD